MAAIHQLVAGFSKGDAISDEARTLQGIFRRWGYESTIFTEAHCIHPELRREADDIRGLHPTPGDVVLLHLSIGSAVNVRFAGLDCRRVILYHNITPPGYFTIFHPQTAEKLRQGREQMAALAGAADINLADSRFNAAELVQAGYTDVRVLPLVIDFRRLDVRPDPTVMEAYRDGIPNVLFVGRCAPNKCIDDLIRLFAVYQRNLRPPSRLLHVGSFTGMEAYHGLCRIQARNLGLSEVHFLGSVSRAQLAACYRVADVFLSASEHEGFCIPLLESMHFDVPVIAFAAGAVPETMDGAGILYRDKSPAPVAEMLDRLVADPALRQAVIAGQRARLRRYHALNLEDAMRARLTPVLDPP